ncbi:MAG: DUF3667 domain-containing protein [Opitutaceae bacterium]
MTSEEGMCANCGALRQGPFCSQCGQKQAHSNPSLEEFFHDVLHELVHLDGKIWHSVVYLLARPGFLTRERFEGRRIRYVSPLRLYLTFSLIYFAVAAFVPSEGDLETLVRWGHRLMFFFVPLFAGFVALTTRSTGRHFVPHLEFSLHYLAVWFLLTTLTTISGLAAVPYVSATISMAANAASFVYLVLALRKAYGFPFFGALWRSCAISIGVQGTLILLLRLVFVVPEN